MGAPNATGRGSCGQARMRAAPLCSALTVTAPLSVAGGGGRDEGRSGQDFDGLRRVEQRAGMKAQVGLALKSQGLGGLASATEAISDLTSIAEAGTGCSALHSGSSHGDAV